MLSDTLIVPGSATRLLTLDECRPELKQIYALWNTLRGERPMPSRRDFKPTAARSLLPHLLLVDVFPDQPQKRRFRVRLHGTAQVRYQGDDWTGAYIHEKGRYRVRRPALRRGRLHRGKARAVDFDR